VTCIIGTVHGDRVYIGADSAAVSGGTIERSALPKVFRRGHFLIGYTTSFRMGQLLQHFLDVPPRAPRQRDGRYMVVEFAEHARDLFESRGYSRIESNTHEGGAFLVGYRGRIYEVHSDYQVHENTEGFSAMGSGECVARGAMAALHGFPPVTRIRRSLAIVSRFSTTVCGPFRVRSMGDRQ